MRLQIACASIAAAVSAAAAASPPPLPRQDPPAAAGPRTDHAVGYYDPRLQRVVLVGGTGEPRDGARDSVWTWNGQRWEPAPEPGPPARVNASAAFDAGRGLAVVAGGSRKTADGTAWRVVGDTWIGGPAAWRAIGELAPRDHQALVEDGSGVLLFGGIGSNRATDWPGDTWRLDGDTWRRIATEGPPGRGRTALAFDSRRRQVVLFGGAGAPSGPQQSQTFFGDTWIWQGDRWRKAAEEGPRGRYAHGMVFDEAAGVVLLYSGAGAHRGAPLADMWQWDGERWREIPLTGETPGHRYQPVMVYDRARRKTVLYGGIGGSADTWEWDGRRWQRIG